MKESPFALSWSIVVIKFTDPRSDDVIRQIIPKSQTVCPAVAITDRGAYDVHPEAAAPPGIRKLESIVSPPTK
jgi:hypothetical protein